MDTVKSWMDVEEIRKMAAELLEEPSDLEVLKEEADNEESQRDTNISEARERALKAISEAANKLNQSKSPENNKLIKSSETSDVKRPLQMQPIAEKQPIPVSKSVEELLKPTGKTTPVEQRAPVSNRTKLPTKEELSSHSKVSGGEFDFGPLAAFAEKSYTAKGLFIFDRDDDLYFDSIENDKFLEVAKSMMAVDRDRVPESMYLRLGVQRFLQLAKFDTNRGIFHVGLIVDSLLQKDQLKELEKEFSKLTN